MVHLHITQSLGHAQLATMMANQQNTGTHFDYIVKTCVNIERISRRISFDLRYPSKSDNMARCCHVIMKSPQCGSNLEEKKLKHKTKHFKCAICKRLH